MSWDAQARKRYEEGVLAAARTRGLPEDLFTRYGIDEALDRRLRSSPAAFDAHVAEVCTYWRGLQSRRALKRVLVDLVAAHDRLRNEGALTHAHFQRVRREAAAQVRAEWEDLAGNLTTATLDRATFRSMLDTVRIGESEAEEILLDKGVRVVDRLPELPSKPPIPTFRTLRDNLRTRGVVFSPMVVFGEERLTRGFTVIDGFRLTGGPASVRDTESVLNDAALSAAARRIQVEAMTDGKAAAENVLSILRTSGDRDRRDAIVLWEIVSDLRERPSALAESGLARHWVRRGLAESEAMLLAAAVRRAGAGVDLVAQAEQDVRALLSDNLLRQAQAAAVDLPADHALQTRLRERTTQVDGFVREAERALREGSPEEAARALASAVDVAADDEDLASRLGEVAPLPPRGASARVDGQHVVVTWQHSPSLAGVVTYRVSRRTGRGGSSREVVVGELSGTELTDESAAVGSDSRYTVVAVRGGRAASPAVSTSSVMITPEVSDLRVHAGERSVAGTWRAPAEAVRVEVLRGEGAPPRGLGDGVLVETDKSGFRDSAVRPDAEYFYRVRAVYLTSQGQVRGSAGLVRGVSPGPRPVPVRDLSVGHQEGTGFLASWTPPPRGRVELRVGSAPPDWSEGSVVGADQLAAFGHEVLEEAGAGADGRTGVGLVLASGTHHVLPVTVVGDQAVVGRFVRITATPPVVGLHAERFDTAVRVSWTWPVNATTAIVTWRPASRDDPDPVTDAEAADEGELRCTRRQYESDGGFEAHMGSGPVRVSVRTVVASSSVETLSTPAGTTVPGSAVLDYHIKPAGLLRRERLVRVTAGRLCDTPEIAVVYAPGQIQPHTPDQGEVLETLPATRLGPGESMTVLVRPPRRSGPGWLVCFPVGAGTHGVRLRQPSVKELRL